MGSTGTTNQIVKQAVLTITAVTNTKIYDGTTSAAAIPIVSGLEGSDTVTNLTETYATATVGTGKTLNVSTYTVNDGNGGHNYTVTLVASTTGVITAGVITASSVATASFLGEDTTTEGTWIGTYGTQGYDLVGSTASIPSYATVTPSAQSSWTWAATSTDPRALRTASGTGRIAASWYASSSFSVDVDFTDGQTHDLELYFVDWDSTARSESVTLSDAVTGAVLSTETVSSFHSGVYLEWAVSGNVLIRFTTISGSNAVLSGLFFDPANVPNVALAAPAGGIETGSTGAAGTNAIGTLNFTSPDIDSRPAATVDMTTITTAAVVPITAIALETAETSRNRVTQDSSANRHGTTWGLGIE